MKNGGEDRKKYGEDIFVRLAAKLMSWNAWMVLTKSPAPSKRCRGFDRNTKIPFSTFSTMILHQCAVCIE